MEILWPNKSKSKSWDSMSKYDNILELPLNYSFIIWLYYVPRSLSSFGWFYDHGAMMLIKDQISMIASTI